MPREGLTLVRWLLVWCVALGHGSPGRGQDLSDETSPPRQGTGDVKKAPISLDGGASINPFLLTGIKDDTLGLTADDREVYFRILKLTDKLDPQELRTLAHEFREDRHAVLPQYRRRPLNKFPTFVDLFLHPDAWRGRPVTLHGVLRRLVTYPPGSNDQGYEQLFEGWLYPDDGQSNPAVVVFSVKPEDLPIGGDLTEEITVTGYFLKRYGYQAHDSARKAPLILANSVRWRPQQEIRVWTPPPQLFVLLSLAVAVIGFLIFLGVRESQLSHEQERQARQAKYAEFVPFDDSVPSSSIEPSRNGTGIEPHH